MISDFRDVARFAPSVNDDYRNVVMYFWTGGRDFALQTDFCSKREKIYAIVADELQKWA